MYKSNVRVYKLKKAMEYACSRVNMSLSDLALALETEYDVLLSKIESETFEYKELVKIAEILKCEYNAYFLFPDGSKASRYNDMIKFAINRAKTCIRNFASHAGYSPAGFYAKLNRNKFTQTELKEYAEKLGCKYISKFKFPNQEK